MNKVMFGLLSLFIFCMLLPISAQGAIKITEVVPAIGAIGLPVTIKGENFNTIDDADTVIIVKFADQEAAEVELLSDPNSGEFGYIRAITPVSQSGAVDVSVNIKHNDSVVEDTLENGFTYNGFFVFNPNKEFGGENGIYDPDSGQNIPIRVDIPVTSLPPGDEFPSIYIKPADKKTLYKNGFDVDRIIGDIAFELKIRDEAGSMITEFHDSILITLLMNEEQSPVPDVFLLSDSTQEFMPTPTEVREDLSPPILMGEIKHLSPESSYLAAGINHAPTIKLETMNSELQVMNTGERKEIILGGEDSDEDDLNYIITELPTGGYLYDDAVELAALPVVDLVLYVPFTLKSNTITYMPETGYFGHDQFKFKVSDSAMESETQVVKLDVSLLPPEITRISPKIGPTSGGTSVMLTGKNFVYASKVYFGEKEAERVMFISPDLINAVTPSISSAKTLSVKVVNPDGQSAVLGHKIGLGSVASLGFEFNDPPIAAEIEPKEGSMEGGTSISITGENFIDDAKVYIGETEATGVVVSSGTSITAVTEPSPPGTFDVIVETTGGTSVVAEDDAKITFTYTPIPLINTVTPSRIPASGGMELEISGENFTEVTVTIGGTTATVTLITETLIVVSAPVGNVGTADVVVTTSDDQTATLTAGVTYIESPVVTSIIPTTGPTAGGTSLRIIGANFVEGTTVTVGGISATDTAYLSSTEITAKTPANQTGFFDVVVTKPDDESTTVISGFGYIAPPSITSVEPTEASIEGGTPLTITGENFDESATVTIGGTVAQSSTEITANTQMTARTPAIDLDQDGTVDLIVTNTDGQSDSIDFTYKVFPPNVTSVSPSIISTAGGTTVVVKGSSFVNGLTVTIDGNEVSDVTYVTNKEIRFVTQAHPSGTVDLQAANPDEQSGQLSAALTYVDKPFIDSITPNSGNISGGTSATITGSNFENNATVKIGGKFATDVNVVSETEITVSTPSTPFTVEKTVEEGEFAGTVIEVPTGGFADIVVDNPTSGQKTTLIGGFNYLSPPEIDSVEPDSSTTLGGQLIAITGTNFQDDATVAVGGTVLIIEITANTQITTTTPPSDQNEDQTVDLVVTNPDGLSDTISFDYKAPTPVIVSVSPSVITTAGGTIITIKGSGFVSVPTVEIDGSTIGNVSFVSNEEIQVQTPAHSAGTADVKITNPGDQSGSLAEALNFVDKPFIDSVTPNIGPVLSSTSITISGSNFDSDATVTIGEKSATNVTVVSETEITATTPSDDAGFADIVVENLTSGLKATLIGGFNYLTPPQVDSVTPGSGSVLGGQLILIAGENFEEDVTLTIGGTVAQSSTEITANTQITATAPAMSAGKYDVVVQNPSGLEGTLVEGFEYVTPAPTINSIIPHDGPTAGGVSIAVSGINFFEGATVSFGGKDATDVEVISSDQINATLPEGTEGTVDVVVTNPDAQFDTMTGGFTYTVKTPTITSISPESGSTTGGTPLTINGEHFLAGVTVTIGGADATEVNVISASELQARTPAGSAGTADVVVTHSDWDSPVTLSDGFTYIALPPELDSIQPLNGPAAGGTTITITGNYFVDGAEVAVGGTVAQSSTEITANAQITAKTPAGSAGSADIVVTNPDTQSGTLPDAFAYIPVPTVTGISPNIGPTSGNTAVTITGENIVDGAVVTIGGNVGQIANLSATKIYAKTPAGSAGSADIVVTNPAEQQSNTLTGGFSYIPVPILTEIAPDEGPVTGGTSITITGENFVDSTDVRIGGKSATDVVITATEITAQTPSGSAGSADIVVTNPANLSDTLSGGFTYIPPPTITEISPTSGPEPGDTTITITGTNFQDDAEVTIGGTVAQSSTEITANTQITTTTPQGSGTVDVVVTNPDAQSDTLTSAFTYIPPPTVSAISPTSGPESGNTAITITGENFQDDATVAVGGTVVEVSATSPTQITTTTPEGSGTVDVVVTNPDAQSGTLPDAFAYISPPTVTEISPTSGPEPGDTEITITGTNFQDDAEVTIGGTVAQSSTEITANTQITTTTPEGSGTVDIVVTNPDSQSDTLTSAFTYISPPTIKSIAPSRCAISGGITVIINGKGFQDNVVVKIGDNSATEVTVDSSTQIGAKIPESSYGAKTVDVVVTNPDSQSDTLSDVFTYVPPPTVTAISPTSGPMSGNTKITLTGEDFVYGATVTIGSQEATDVIVNSSTSITAKTSESSAGAVDVVVTNPLSQSATLSSEFTYLPIIQKSVKANSAHQFSLFHLMLQIPVGAVPANKILEAELPVSLPPFLGGLHDLDRCYELHFAGEINPTFDQPLTLIFNYQDDQLPSNVSEESLRVYSLEDGLWKFVGGTVDTENNTVTVEIDHFSSYSLQGGYAYGDVTGSGEIGSFDAALVLQKAVGFEIPPEGRPAFRFQTGDVSGNEAISAFDSALILRKSVGLPPDPNYPGRMEFPVEIQETATGAGIFSTPSQAVFVRVKEVNEELQVQFMLSKDAENIIAVDLQWPYVPKMISFVSVSETSKNILIQTNDSTGKLKVNIASIDQFNSKDPVLTIMMHRSIYDPEPVEKLLRTVRVQLNERQTPVEIASVDTQPTASLLLQNYPNPFNPETWIPYLLEAEGEVKIKIYNLTGQLIRTLDLGVQLPGRYVSREKAAYWNGRTDLGERVASSTYFYVLKAGDFSSTRKMVILK